MKFTSSLVAAVLALASVTHTDASAHPFAICQGYTDHLHVEAVDMVPDKPAAKKDFTLKVKFTPDATYEKPLDVDVSVKVFGVKVFEYKFDACSDVASEFIKCPLTGGKQQSLQASTVLPEEVPSNIEANIQILIKHGSSPISCIQVKVNTEKHVGSGAAEEDEDEFVNYFLTSFQDETYNAVRPGAHPIVGDKQMNKHVKSMRFIFGKWLEQFHKEAEVDEWYPVKSDEAKLTFEERFKIFAKNVIDILIHNRRFNAGKVTFAKRLNQFGHLTPQEFRGIFLSGYRPDTKNRSFFKELASFFGRKANQAVKVAKDTIIIPDAISAANGPVATKDDDKDIGDDGLPNEIDWVSLGKVGPVKNQGACGSCWAFSAISALESAYAIKYNELKSFSEQVLVSCETDCYGCRGGIMNNAFDWIKAKGGICTSQDYPYTSGTSGSNGLCKLASCSPDPRTAIKSFVEVEHTEQALKEAVSQQPVSVAIEADQYAFQFYSHGVLTGECGDRDDHGVVIVGYGSLDGVDFWKMRNSWGPTWGMEGYVLIQRGKVVPSNNGQCGLLVDPVYPVL